ncbi:MAG TPA: nickel pincer cofactor biosynthesis protein LarB [Chthoniobacterales bacterium]
MDHTSFVHAENARVDTGRHKRCGFPEVIFCEGKTPNEVASISVVLAKTAGIVLGTRASRQQYDAVLSVLPEAVFNERARCITWNGPAVSPLMGKVAVVCAGTSDAPVAGEAVVTLETFGVEALLISDVGVAGIHRLLAVRDDINACDVIIVVAGMEGALPGVVAGLVEKPVIAVPTSVGYGANFGGLAALLGMLNSCGSGVTVVNIDNGFGAAYAAATITRLLHRK